MKGLRERVQALIRIASSSVEKRAYAELPSLTIALSGAVAAALTTLTLLAVAHLVDVIVLRHFYAFLIGYIATVFSSIGLILAHTFIGAVTAYVDLKAEELLDSGHWLAFACFLPLFAPTGTFMGERLARLAFRSGSPPASVLGIVLSIVITLAMTWLFWVPWMGFYRIWLNRSLARRHASKELKTTVTRQLTNDDALEASRSYMRVRRQIALIRKHRAEGLSDEEAKRLGLFEDLSGGPERSVRDRRATDFRRSSRAGRIGLVSAAVLLTILLTVAVYGILFPESFKGALSRKGAGADAQVIRVLVKAEKVNPAYVADLVDTALTIAGGNARIDMVDINRFSTFAVQAIIADGRSGIVIGTRQELRDMANIGILVDLTPMIERDLVDLTKFVDPCIEELSRDGSVFGLPLSTSPLLLYINTQALSHTNLNPHVPPVLWSDLLSYAKSLTWFTNSGGTQVVSQLGFAPSSRLWHAWLQLASKMPVNVSGSGFQELPGADISASVPHSWRLLVDVASGLRATALPDDLGRHRNPFYEQPYDPAMLFAQGHLAMVVSDCRLHRILSGSSSDLEYAVADLPAPDWSVSGTSVSDGLGVGILLPRADLASETQPAIEISWDIIKTLATDESLQASMAQHSGLLPGLKSLYTDSPMNAPAPRTLSVGKDEIDRKFSVAQLTASPAVTDELSSASLNRLYALLDRLTQGAESVSSVLEQIAATLAVK